ncbi:MAG TPA: S9 family peptidase [Candidatus Baltobacteraceae bacterium]|nr:S9 family peptidase [Candidatus Baltobacteraceae bacterium]
MKHAAVLCAAFAALFSFTAATPAPPTMRSVLQSVFALHDYSGVALSPRGDELLWQETFRPGGLDKPKPQSEIFIERIGSAPVRLTAGDGKAFFEESNATWAPDGKSIAFFSNASGDQTQIYVAPVYGTGVKQLTHLTGAVQTMRWSPDGKRLAVLIIPHPHRRSGALAAGARKVGEIGTVEDEQQLAVVDAQSGSIREITPPNAYVYEYGWAPDSKRLAYTYAYGSGDNNWWIARLAITDVNGAHRDLFKPAFQINDPQWSPDGSRIAIVGGIMSDFGPVGGDVYAVNVRTGAARDMTPGMPYNAAAIRWVTPSKLIMLAHDRGSLHIYSLNAASGHAQPLTSGSETIGSLSMTPTASAFAFVRSTFDRPAEVWAGKIGALHQITHANANVPKLYDRAQSLTWKSDKFNVQGWLVYPLHYDARKKYPLVMIVHGGPSSESVPSYDSRNVAALTSHGYFVLEPNPRGSYGQGEAFTRANIKDFGYGDWRDDLAGLDAAIKTASVDPNKLGLFGWSYGGYMGMWAETQTRRLKAIVAGAGIVNWQSYYGQNDIDQWMIPFFGKSVYDDPAVYAKSSPITFIKNSHTPVLILQGERDEEVPAPQAFEFYHAMQTLHVPSRLVVYADEGHGPRMPENQIDILNRMVDWFAHYL